MVLCTRFTFRLQQLIYAIGIVVIVTVLTVTRREFQETEQSPFSSNTSHNFKYILSWTREPNMLKGHQSFRGAQCPQPCYFTANRSLLPSVEDFDAIMIFQRTWNMKKDAPVPRRRSQRYVYWAMESPVHAFYDQTSLKATRNFYNWSLSYRKDSTFHAPYGRVQQVQSHPSGKELDKIIQDFGSKNKKLAQKDTHKDASSTSPAPAPAAWFVTNCDSRSGREDLVKQLEEILAVDRYGQGKCSRRRLTCKTDASCMNMLGSTYKFYLALENSLCEEYVTEKFWKLLNYNVIPVLLNGENMTRQAPPHSYIDIKDFPSLEELGSYLLRVSSDPALYSSYFWWRDYYTVRTHYQTYNDAFCDLCQALHDQERGEERIEDLDTWWMGGQGFCKQVSPPASANKKVNFDKSFWAYRNRDSDD